MSELHLDEWAAHHGISKRTAQRWAKEKLIPATRKKIAKRVLKTWFGYVIEKDVLPPDLSR